ncbi:MAG: DUF2723 domain-containing protein [Alloprevotella sp.]|nr:DUF2723 domain-containing protein [Prevotellamassilia sp.]MDY5763082.1 DUF2723 domain-containing protein [Alloprevotella sp.]
MKQYKLINNIFGWLAFVIAATTYCLTVEPTASFWDCPEFITTASKLEVGHPPGAPFFMLTGNFFTLFTSNPEHIAVCINVMSALLSAFCILFLFWTITHLARKLVCKDGIVTDTWQTVLIMGAGLTGALAYTWSDTFWFSAVEGEVYGYSSMFTALVFWLILKWEDHADEPHSDRWLVLIFYLTGLSIGVHLLNLLCLPAIALVYYFKKKPNANTSGSLCALGISMLLVVAVLYGVVPGIVKVGGWFELFFVNVMGMSFNTGLVIYILLLIAIVLAAIWSTTKNRRALIVVLYTLSVLLLGIPFFMGRSTMAIIIGLLLTCGLPVLLTMRHKGQYVLRKRFLNTSLLCMLMLMIGYSSYAVIVIRSTQNTPMDQNSPEDIFSLGTYLSREQYGDTPLFYGPAFSSTPCYEPVFNEETGETMYMYMVKKSEAVVRHEKQDPNEPDRYDHMETNDGLEYPGAMKMLFPRMHSGGHASHYQQWMGDITMHDVDATWTTSAGEKMSGEGQMPSQWDNIRFFTSYQVNFMYWRYFMWNFAGRQNDIQGHGNPDNGNWITGFSFIDNWLYGDQSKLPNDLKDNKGHNAFYCLPLLLGLLGLFWQAFKGQRGIQQFWVVFFLFFMTGLAIVMYLNQTPSQPRERDYAYAGSFYAFAIWIGLGAMALGDWLNKLVKNKPLPVSVGVSALSLLVPIQMVSQTWDDHDRSGRYACRDFGLNYLNTLPEDNMPIIFTNGDNDTFPLWYAQEVEGKRTDARVCNLSYLQTDWYTDQMKRQAYESAPLPIAWSRYEYVDNRGKGFDYFEVKPEMRSELDAIKQRTGVNTYDLKYIIDHYVRGRIAKGQPGVIPTDSVMVPVNKQAVIAQGTTLLGGKDSIPDYITIHFGNSVTKSQMMVYEMVARNDWKRPIYMSVTLGGDLTNSNYAGLGDYLVLEGLAYRLTPFRHARTADGRPNLVIDSEKMYDNMMNRFKYGNVAAKNIYLDETVMRMCSTHRNMFILLVKQLLNEGKTDKARKALEKCKQVLPPENIPYDDYDTDVVTAWLGVGNTKEASRVALAIFGAAHDYLNWGNTLNEERQAHMMEKFRGKLSVLYRILEIQDKFDKDTRAKIARLAAQSEALSLVQTIYNNLEQNYNQPSSLPTIDLGGDGDGLGDF